MHQRGTEIIEREQQTTAYPFSTTVVIPAYNEAHGIAAVVARVREMLPEAEILVVDDASSDATGAAAAAAGARVERHPANRGNGAAVKTGIRRATGEVVLLMDADGQMDPRYIPQILAGIANGYDMVVGARTRATQGDNLARRLGNRALDTLGSYLVETEVRDLTSGYRAMRRSVMLEFIHLLPNRYSYPTTSTLALLKGGYGVGFVSIEGQRRGGGQSGQKLFKNGVRFGLIILRMISLFAPLRVYFPVALGMFILGMTSWLLNIFLLEPTRGLYIPNSALLLFVGSIIIFMFGLLAEQIAALRFQRRDD
ncbi:glycosyltransferase family 2 protein [Candidatus Viridilinea mediisalina]|uniref:Glycosyl transferase n=1 Tax=Candidatus Viridilinea mediisalina TaxID=2024553 RepID=A0A2A6RMP7_9CHLR|nr:glycosyltransferase family 2 protein [Candidatus Viridilinea mediisalina]PDW04317.1 glycosyl transferase [Candidatus Viridilinea mediisalina]